MNLLRSSTKNHLLYTAKKFFSTEAKFQTKPYRLYRLEQGPAPETILTRDEALKHFRTMTVIRKMEAKINTLYKAKQVHGFCHLYSGQEAVAVGMYSTFGPDDCAITSYRCHGWTYLFTKEEPLVRVIGELLGREIGVSKGKGGSMHMYAKNFYGGNAIVGAQVPLGVGVALALKYTGKKACCVALYGDGAGQQGQVFEAFNIAKLWNLPCMFVCENNRYGMGTSVSRSTANPDYYTKGDAIPGVWVDGNDFFSVKEATKFARDFCITDKGPIVLEMETYRYFGHSLSDPGTSYRTREEVEVMRKTKDPIKLFQKEILASGLVKEEELKKIDNDVKKEVEQAAAKAKASKLPGLEALTDDVYVKPLEKGARLSTYEKLGQLRTSGRAWNAK